MSEIWIVNASPVISLAKIGHLELLEQLSPQILVPDAVVEEILVGPPSDPARKALESGWGTRISPQQIPRSILEWSLGAGESSVVALGLEKPSSSVVLDDDAARKCARTLGLSVLGTLGVILRAKRAGLIASAVSILEALRASGFRLDNKTVRDALERSTGERWPY